MAPSDHEALTPSQRAQRIKQRATELGFASCGITDLRPPPHAQELTRWLESGMAGSMTYMGRQAKKRMHPERILEGATRAVVLTRHYDNPDPDPKTGTARVAKYARGADYHTTLQEPLSELAETIAAIGDEKTFSRTFVDAGPVPERELAQRAGLGWIGKNTMLIDPNTGSYFFIAEVLTNLDVEVDEPFETDRCGTCTRCLDACPTNAFPQERVLDARLCISYLTIEHRGEFDAKTPSLSTWIFGCDICQIVCPWNAKFSKYVQDPILALDPALAQIDLDAFENLNDSEFDDQFAKTPFARPGLSGMKRNAKRLADEMKSP